MARWIIATGIILVIAGSLLHFAPGLFSWFGKLPGDIRVNSGRGRIFVPITSMIIVSVVLTLLLNLFRFFKF